MIYQNSAWRKETGMTLDPLGQPLEPVLKINKPSTLIGKKAYIKDTDEVYAGHWGFIIYACKEDDEYHISGGSIGDFAASFTRRDFVIRRSK